jgi:hypothetical protein
LGTPEDDLAVLEARRALEDIAAMEARISEASNGPPPKAERPRLIGDQLWAEWTGCIRFQRRSTMTPRLKASIIRTYGVRNYRKLAAASRRGPAAGGLLYPANRRMIVVQEPANGESRFRCR